MRSVLALNCGSSSLKFGLYRSDGRVADLIGEGEAEEIGSSRAGFWWQKQGSRRLEERGGKGLETHAGALAQALECLREIDAPQPQIAGHRFVHGGPHLREHQLLNESVKRELENAASFAPLHMPTALSVLRSAEEKLPGIPQAICFDTTFHRHMPPVSKTYPLPQAIRELGVERYGFHGISLESILAQLDRPIPHRLIVAHLGNGASITAIKDGVSVDTSMGLTPTGGVMMGTRCGDLDPGIMIFLLRKGYPQADQLENMVDHESGLSGVSGLGSDVRALLAARKRNQEADLALSMFCYQIRKVIAAMAAALGGLDVLVFTGGIGENAAELRAEICSGLAFLGIKDDAAKILVLPSKEDAQIALNAARLVS